MEIAPTRATARVTALWRACRVVTHVLVGVWKTRVHFRYLSPAQQEEQIQAWALDLLAQLAIKLVVKGAVPASGPMLLVANHISWLDILVLHAARHCRFVAKSELRNWPLLGKMVSGAGTLFVQRDSRRDAMRVVRLMAQALERGEVLAAFPEGTTSDGSGVLPFHGNLLQAAIDANAPVLPVALHYVDSATGAPSLAPAYVGEDSLLQSVWRVLTAKQVVVEILFGEPEFAAGRDRRAWAAALQDQVTRLRLPLMRCG